jgi:CsoR family transcriptional regulator, copper-sensing transcriptional repressor
VRKIFKKTAKVGVSARSKCASSNASPQHPCHGGEIKRLNRILGQVDGVKKMILERRYCPEILVQVKASRSALKALEAALLKTHVEHCIKNAAASKDKSVMAKKIDELMKILKDTTT